MHPCASPPCSEVTPCCWKAPSICVAQEAVDRQVRKHYLHLTSHSVCPPPAGRMAQLEAQLQRAQDTGEADRAALQAARGEVEALRSQAAEAEAAEAMHLAHQASCSGKWVWTTWFPARLAVAYCVICHCVCLLHLLWSLTGVEGGVHACAGGHCWAASSLHSCMQRASEQAHEVPTLLQAESERTRKSLHKG